MLIHSFRYFVRFDNSLEGGVGCDEDKVDGNVELLFSIPNRVFFRFDRSDCSKLLNKYVNDW